MTIRLTVRLFGTLSLNVPDYDHEKGLIVDMSDGVTPVDLLNDLQIPLSHVGLISHENHTIQLDTPLTDKMTISFFSLVAGG
ncbi:MAG: hypothetical protein PF503_23465 [Desulfobacula sp.]|jgi:molybdopterin converting factor small subunit|nr:hypothetical protein [Desulfobacula sp.]